MAKTTVVQDPSNEVPIKILAQSIVDISTGIKKLRAGPIVDKGLLLLIQHSAPTKNNSTRYALHEISDILNGIEDLAETFIKKVNQNGNAH